MKKIFVRSPYTISVNIGFDELGSKVELFFYTGLTPSQPNYTISKKKFGNEPTYLYNVAPFAKEFINNINPNLVSTPTTTTNGFTFMDVKSYIQISDGSYVLASTETFACFDGYTQYLDGYNFSSVGQALPLVNTNIKRKTISGYNYINAFLEVGNYEWDMNGALNSFSVTTPKLYKLPYSDGYNALLISGGVNALFAINSEVGCEVVTSAFRLDFINRFGGWEMMSLFGASAETLEVQGSEYSLLQGVNYNTKVGQKKAFNKQGTRKIKVSTGWVNENYSELIEDLMLSETILLNDKSVMLTNKSMEVKTHLKDNNINYELEFEYNYGLINDVV